MKAGKKFAKIESGKWLGKVFGPVNGELAEVNEELEIKLVQKMGYRIKATLDCGVYEIQIRFDDVVDQPTFELTYPDAWQKKTETPQEDRF